jgi:hypothetical protein
MSMFLARARYRSRQFFGALRAEVGEDDRVRVARVLGPELERLFYTMDLRDQRHGLDVLGSLERRGHDDDVLLAAALLHDVGKGPIRLWHRVAFVLLEAASPRLLERVASRDGASWRRTLWRCRHHPELGAALAEAAGAPSQAVRLIRMQDERDSGDPMLTLLQQADEDA